MSAALLKRLQLLSGTVKRELRIYQLVLRDPRTPPVAKILLGLAVGYALLPFDLIPDFIPIIGHLDDVVIVPGLVWLALKLIPSQIVGEHRRQVAASFLHEQGGWEEGGGEKEALESRQA